MKILYTKKIYFGGKNFDELKKLFEQIPGVLKIVGGFIDAQQVSSYVNPEPHDAEKIFGVEVEFNPKKTDISTLIDNFFAEFNPYVEKNLGVYYSSGEDAPQVELHMNFIANRGKQVAASSANLTINDPNSNPKLARKCYASAGRLKSFSAKSV